MSEKRWPHPGMDDDAVRQALLLLRKPAYERLSNTHDDARDRLEVMARQRGLVVDDAAGPEEGVS